MIASRTRLVQLERDSGLRLLLAALQFQAQLDEEELFEDQPYVRRRARRLQVRKALAGIGPVNFPQRLAAGTRFSRLRTAAGMGSGSSGVRFSSAVG